MTNTESSRTEFTVVFADLAGSTQLYQRVGDAAAFRLVDRCLQLMRSEIERHGGRVVKHTGDGLMAVFAAANAAADTAVNVHRAIRELPLPGGQKIAVRLAFHSGPVVESDNDVFGDTVNVAARLLELASPGRAITSAETAARLEPEWQALLHPLKPRALRGVTRVTRPFELVCESPGDLTIVQSVGYTPDEKPELRLYLGARSLVLDERMPSVRLGRDPSSDLCVSDTRASRQHAQIELRGDKFVLIDRSSNGTFVAVNEEKEFVLSHEEVVLRKHGQLALGRSCVGNPQVIGFVCV